MLPKWYLGRRAGLGRHVNFPWEPGQRRESGMASLNSLASVRGQPGKSQLTTAGRMLVVSYLRLGSFFACLSSPLPMFLAINEVLYSCNGHNHTHWGNSESTRNLHHASTKGTGLAAVLPA